MVGYFVLNLPWRQVGWPEELSISSTEQAKAFSEDALWGQSSPQDYSALPC